MVVAHLPDLRFGISPSANTDKLCLSDMSGPGSDWRISASLSGHSPLGNRWMNSI